MKPEPKIVATEDGSQTLIHSLLGEKYHSDRGAVGEAMHVFIRNGFEAHPSTNVRILEVGFGSGLNALLTLLEAQKSERKVHYTSIELYPLSLATVEKLDYSADPNFLALHKAAWGEESAITSWFTLKKIEADLLSCHFDTTFDIVYFDAFAPDTQPELWSEEVFRKIYTALSSGGILVTYSAKGVVKQALRGSEFSVERLEGALGKRHMLKAMKI